MSPYTGFCGVAVIMSALHAEGREFEPRRNLSFFKAKIQRRGNIPFVFPKNSTLAAVGFEPTPPKRLVPKTSALDHSATLPC